MYFIADEIDKMESAKETDPDPWGSSSIPISRREPKIGQMYETIKSIISP